MVNFDMLGISLNIYMAEGCYYMYKLNLPKKRRKPYSKVLKVYTHFSCKENMEASIPVNRKV
jgi:hypothetical protein